MTHQKTGENTQSISHTRTRLEQKSRIKRLHQLTFSSMGKKDITSSGRYGVAKDAKTEMETPKGKRRREKEREGRNDLVAPTWNRPLSLGIRKGEKRGQLGTCTLNQIQFYAHPEKEEGGGTKIGKKEGFIRIRVFEDHRAMVIREKIHTEGTGKVS